MSAEYGGEKECDRCEGTGDRYGRIRTGGRFTLATACPDCLGAGNLIPAAKAGDA